MIFSDLLTCTPEEREAIERLAKAEIIRGVGDGKYNPDGLVTRKHMALYIDRDLRWEELAVDEHADSSALLFTMSMTGGSASWRAPRVLMTNKHVPLNIHSDGNGTTTVEYRDLLCLANPGLVRWDNSPGSTQKQFHVVWDRLDSRDIAYLVVPQPEWDAYLAMRERAGLPREPRYINPAEGREVRWAEKCITFGCPLVRYEFYLDSGVIGKIRMDRGNETDPIIYAVTSAAINPGNSGGICVGVDRAFLGIPSLKPYYGNPLSGGYVPADNIGEILTAAEIVKWEKRGGIQAELRSLGIVL